MGMSAVSMMSLMPIGMPSIADSGLAVLASARTTHRRLLAHHQIRDEQTRRSSAPRWRVHQGSVRGTRAAYRVRRSELCGGGKKRPRLRHGRGIRRQHGQASASVMAATRRWLAIIEVRSRNWRARAGSAAISRSSSRLRRRISGSRASRRFLFAIDCSCTYSVATVRRCKL